MLEDRGIDCCVFYLNGTRRWFLLEHADDAGILDEENARRYPDLLLQRIVEIYRLLYDFGFKTILSPGIVAGNLDRGEGYVGGLFGPVLTTMAVHPDVLALFDDYDVRVRTYGDIEDFLPAEHHDVLDAVGTLVTRTEGYRTRRFFLGLCALDHARSAARTARDHFEATGRVPTNEELIRTYYGDDIRRIHVSFSFGRTSVHGTPFFSCGEDLYFLAAPSMYFGEATLRNVLYDKLFSRSIDDVAYDDVSPERMLALRDHYRRNRDDAFGIGARDSSGRLWHPLPGTTFTERDAEELVADPQLRQRATRHVD